MILPRTRAAASLVAAALVIGLVGCGPPPEEVGVIDVAGFGQLRLRFYPDVAPNHVDNFKKLARAGFYDGTTFHRVIPGFMIQGGDPNSKDGDMGNDGLGGPGYTIAAEFSDIPHREGILSMARAADPDSAGSQFFIMLRDHADWASMLDGKYTVFGEVTEGMDIARAIASVKKDSRNRPLKNVVMRSVRIETAPRD